MVTENIHAVLLAKLRRIGEVKRFKKQATLVGVPSMNFVCDLSVRGGFAGTGLARRQRRLRQSPWRAQPELRS